MMHSGVDQRNKGGRAFTCGFVDRQRGIHYHYCLLCSFPWRRGHLDMGTYTPKEKEIAKLWYVVDAEGQVLGRMAVEVARILKGKHKPQYATHMDVGDYVIIINAGKVRLTGNKLDKKIYYRHSGYPGGLKETPYRALMEKRPEFVVRKAVRGMLPHNRLGRAMLTKLKVYAGPEHPHAAQKPQELKI